MIYTQAEILLLVPREYWIFLAPHTNTYLMYKSQAKSYIQTGDISWGVPEEWQR